MEKENKKVYEQPTIEVINIESESIMDGSTIFGGGFGSAFDSGQKTDNWFGDK